MFYKAFLVCIFFVPLFKVQCQICTVRVIVPVTHMEPYFYSYRETYETNCWFRKTCTKTRRKTDVGHRRVTSNMLKNEQVCCSGYIRDDSSDDSLVCLPICMPSCNNGFCKSPGECECNAGYLVDPTNSHHCLPQCDPPCEHGTCITPNTCECNFGYSFNQTCQPICNEQCTNGLCTAPDTCECLTGFRMSESNTCDPYCSKGCDYGTCVQPETCACDEGYTFIDEKCVPECKIECGNGTCVAPDTCNCEPGFVVENGTCIPVCPGGCLNGYCSAPLSCSCNPGYISDGEECQPYCEQECGNGQCIAPNTCICNDGYELDSTCSPDCCKPVCSAPCVHGSCLAPEFCECDPGYTKDFRSDTCLPDCSFDCGYGICVAPETCECNPGYEEPDDEAVHDPVCVPLCKGCEGTCIRPLTCVCDNGFEAKNETIDGEECDCFENCTEIMHQCVRTICLPKSVDVTTESDVSTKLTEETDYDAKYGLRDYTYDNYYTDDGSPETLSSESRFIVVSTLPSSTIGNNSTILTNEITDTARQQKEKERSSGLVWIYVGIAIMLALIASLISIILVRRKLLRFFGGGSYVIEDKSEPASSTSIDLECISVKKTT